MTVIAARGNEALLGVLIDQPSVGYSRGNTACNTKITSAPSAPTSATNGVGNITGTVLYKVALLTYSGETTPSTAAIGLACTANKVTVTIGTSSETEAWGRKIYRSHDAGATYYWIGTVYDLTTTTYSDNIATDSTSLDLTNVPQTINQSGANWGLTFMWPESFSLDPNYHTIAVPELKGSIGEARGAPGNIDVMVALKMALRAGWIVPLLAAVIGKPAVSENGDGTCTYTFTPSSTIRSPYSLSFMQWQGGSLRPEWLLSAMLSELDIDAASGKVIDLSPKGQARNHTRFGMAEWSSSPNTNYGTVPVIKGNPSYATRATDDLYVKIQTAPSGGTFKIKCKLTSGASYGTTYITVTYNTTSKKQIQTGSQPSDGVELFDSTTGVNYGGDSKEMRRPLTIYFPGDVTQLTTSDEFLFRAQNNALIPLAGTTPGTADGTYTGFPPRSIPQARFTSAHATIFRGTALATATTYQEFDSFKAKLAWGLAPARVLGSEAATATDFDRTGFAKVEVDAPRRFVDRFFQDLEEQDTRIGLAVVIAGEYPTVQPGTLATNRLTVRIDLKQVRTDGTAAPVGGPNVIHEAVKLVGEQTDDLTQEPFTVTVIDGPQHRWRFRT